MQPYYQDDLVTLYFGDSLEITEWLEADVLVTDPPYGVEWKAGGLNDKRAVRQASVQSIKSDESVEARDAALDLWGKKPAIVFGSWRMPRPNNVAHRLIWHKANRQPGITSAPWYPVDEEIYVIGKGFTGGPIPNLITTTEHRGSEPGRVGHPTPKPIGLMESLIMKCPDGVIADPFAGSGATLIAARNLGRRSIGVEYEERYCELIATRASQQAFDLTGITS